VVFVDEVKLVYARGATLQRQLGGRVTVVWRRDGERFHKDCVKPRKGAKQAGGVHLPQNPQNSRSRGSRKAGNQ